METNEVNTEKNIISKTDSELFAFKLSNILDLKDDSLIKTKDEINAYLSINLKTEDIFRIFSVKNKLKLRNENVLYLDKKATDLNLIEYFAYRDDQYEEGENTLKKINTILKVPDLNLRLMVNYEPSRTDFGSMQNSEGRGLALTFTNPRILPKGS